MNEPVYVSLEFTPNPNTLKYTVNRRLLPSGAAHFTAREQAVGRSPMAEKLFGVPGIVGVMIGTDFVTVTKSDEGDWDLVHKGASKIVEECAASGAPAVTGPLDEVGASGTAHKGGNTQLEAKIREVLDREIRPAVAMDGGDITFERFENGVVFLYLKGSCSGCPSSSMTLKMGIETRLKELLPEVKEVVAV